MVTGVGRRAYRWAADPDFALWERDVLDRDCPVCGRRMPIGDHRSRRFPTLDGPVPLICKRNHGPDPACAGHARTQSPARESTLALPQRAVGGDVFCGIGHRRFSRPMAVPWIRSALLDDSQLPLSDEAIEQSIRRDQALRAARPPDAASLRRPDESARDHPGHRRPPAREGA